MKKFFTKIKNLILNHKLLATICLLAFILLVVLLFMVISMTVSTANKYGNRLDGIKEVEIKSKTLKEVENKIKENEEVKDASVRIKGKIIYFDITYNKGTEKDKAKEIANNTLSEFSEEEKSFYDMEYILIEDSNGEDGDTYIDIAPIFQGDNPLHRAINHEYAKGVSPSRFINIKVFRDEAIAKRVNCSVDWSKMRINFDSPEDEGILHIAIYYDREYVNELESTRLQMKDTRISKDSKK